MIKNLVPALVSLDTTLNGLKGSYISSNFDFFGSTENKNKFHYNLEIVDDIPIPEDYDFRNGYYQKVGNSWFYERKILRSLNLKFKFDMTTNTFQCNKLYSYIPIELGGILPTGLHLSDLINLELFLNGYILIRGCAFSLDGKVIGVVAPGFNGKTTFMKQILDQGGRYIAEDLFVLSVNDRLVYPISPTFTNYGRSDNYDLEEILEKNKSINEGKVIDKLYLLINSTRNYSDASHNLHDFIWLNSMFFLSNRFIRSFLFAEKHWKTVHSQLKKLEEIDELVESVSIKDFNFEIILKK
jgi:hypothetical protein